MKIQRHSSWERRGKPREAERGAHEAALKERLRRVKESKPRKTRASTKPKQEGGWGKKSFVGVVNRDGLKNCSPQIAKGEWTMLYTNRGKIT